MYQIHQLQEWSAEKDGDMKIVQLENENCWIEGTAVTVEP